MPIPQTQPSPHITPVVSFPTPRGRCDLAFFERRRGLNASNRLWKYGEKHPNSANYPNHELVFVSPEDHEWERWYYVAERADQHNYNWEYTEQGDWPALVQTFIVKRCDLSLDVADYPAPDAELFDSTGYVATSIEQQEINDETLRSLYVLVRVRREDITDNPLISYVLDPQTNTLRAVEVQKVPAGTTGSVVDATGQYSEVRALNTRWALKTAQFMAGLAGNGDTASQTWTDVINYTWPDVLLGFDFFSFPDENNQVRSITARPVWKRQRYDGPCEATITETWTLDAPTPPVITPMLTRDIEYTSPLMSVRTPPCLHGDVILYETSGTAHPDLGFYVYSQFYEATELTDWPEEYVASYTVRPAAGGYLSRLVVVKRPEGQLFDNLLTLGVPTPGSSVGEMDISWELENPVGTLTGYRLDVNTRPDFTGTFLSGFNNRNMGTDTSETITGMEVGTQYFVRVKATFSTPDATATSNTQSATVPRVVAFTLTAPPSTTVIESGDTIDCGEETADGGGGVTTLRITNTGNIALTGLAAALGGADDDQWSLGTLSSASLAAGDTRDFDLTFDPTTVGVKAATLTVSPTNGVAQEFVLAGEGIWELGISDATAGLPVTNGGTAASLITPDNTPFPFEASNPSGTALGITSVTLSGANAADFTVSGLASSIPGASSDAFEIALLPGTSTGSYTAVVTITHDGTNSPFTFTVNGEVP